MTKASTLNLIDRLQFPWLTASIHPVELTLEMYFQSWYVLLLQSVVLKCTFQKDCWTYIKNRQEMYFHLRENMACIVSRQPVFIVPHVGLTVEFNWKCIFKVNCFTSFETLQRYPGFDPSWCQAFFVCRLAHPLDKEQSLACQTTSPFNNKLGCF